MWSVEGTEPIHVHCGRCNYERVLCYAPVPVDVFAAVGRLPCVSCGSEKVILGQKPKATADGDAIGWLMNGDTGISSQTIWSVMMGRAPERSHWYPDVPQDPSDFGRCYRLLKVMPSWRERLPEVAAKYRDWKPLVEAWDELTALYEEELPKKTAPKLYARMRQLIDETQSVTE